ncbi:MucR family transcriptional regulator [Methylobacterium brachiatum]|uniref:MucR family transcriptional regulator n=1 Tax=Methylobacterium brachiatum TaxID=269660 RepID=UPI00315DC35A
MPATPSEAQIRASVQHEHLVSFLDGRSYKTMKRHLTAHGLTPEGYRQRFGLPADYPMVAPAYAAERSRIAREIQLGVPGKRAQLQAAE